MKSYEQFFADESDNFRSGLIGQLNDILPSRLSEARRVRVRVGMGGKIVGFRGDYSNAYAVSQIEREIDRAQKELDNFDAYMREMYRIECQIELSGGFSLVRDKEGESCES